jgi:hypothetical protein
MLRRAFINALFVAPAIIHAGVLMPISTRLNNFQIIRPERAMRSITYNYANRQVTVAYFDGAIGVFNMDDRPEFWNLHQHLSGDPARLPLPHSLLPITVDRQKLTIHPHPLDIG